MGIRRRLWTGLVLVAALAILLRVAVLDTFRIATTEMEPSFKAGDSLLIFKLPYFFKWSDLGFQDFALKFTSINDPLVFEVPGGVSIGRVKGLPGDTVSFGEHPSISVPIHNYLIVPDAPDEKLGLESHLVSSKDILGKPVLIWLSVSWENRDSPHVRWDRIFKRPN